MDKEEFNEEFKKTTPIFYDLYNFGVIPAGRFWKNRLVPLFYLSGEKVIGKLRLAIDKLDESIGKFDDYLRRKSIPQSNGNSKSEYWNDINEFKDNLNAEDKK